MSMVLQTENLDKRFGRIHAVNDLNLRIESGMIFGLLGPNGSGKTTTLGMLLGVTRPSAGKFFWYGEPGSHQVRKRVGAILEKPVFYPYMSAVQNLAIVCMIKNVERKRIDEVLETVGLLQRRDDAFKTYSLGIKQRLAIASSLLCDPGVMILDEPTNGLDPQGIADIRDLIRTIASSGKTIILASHLLDEVQKVCTDFCVLQKGKLLYTGNVAADLAAENLYDLASDNLEQLNDFISQQNFIVSCNRFESKLVIKTQPGISPAHLNKTFFEQGIVLNHLSAGKRSLEEQFLKILNDNHDAPAAN